MQSFPLVLSALLCSAVASVAYSMPPEVEVRHKEIYFADLNLNHSAGAKSLYQRIRVAARQLCGEPNPLVPARSDDARRCADEATARAIEKVNAPALNKYYASL